MTESNTDPINYKNHILTVTGVGDKFL